MTPQSHYLKILLPVHLLVLALVIFGCTTTTRVPPFNEAMLAAGVPPDSGLAFGRIQLEGWRRAILETSRVHVEWQNQTTRQLYTHTLDPSGQFFVVLPAANYRITEVWSGFQRVRGNPGGEGLAQFIVPSGAAIYLGTLVLQWPTDTVSGEVALADEFEATPGD